MPARSVTPTLSAQIHGITIGGAEPPVSYQGGPSFQETIPANSVNFEITFPCTVANSVIQGISANQDCVVKTEDITTPGQTITLQKNKGRIWKTGDPATAKIFTSNVTKLYVTISTPNVEMEFRVACGDDVTP